MTMKRIQYHQYGGPEVMRLEDFEPAPLGADEVLVVCARPGPTRWTS
jgi:NADPH:quinone reductase-like Zn-dependent oxidoreductase